MTVAACPKPETLAAFARGQLDRVELAGVAEHVGGCEACCRALKLVPDDSLAGLARAAAASPSTVHSGITPAPAVPASNPVPASVPEALANHPRYRIISELGRGGMGVVYKAEHRLMERVVVLKVVAPHLTKKPSAVARFIKEFKAAGKLYHPHIVAYHDAEEAGGLHFMAMEFVDGVSLDRLVAKKGPLPVPMACTFARQAALGLQHAAGKGMVHRDIKPQNLMVTRKGQVKILDFGLARLADTETDDEGEDATTQKLPVGANKPPSNAGVTNPNLLMGTPDYLSPEQAKNSHDVDQRSDIYSLGCTLYFLLTGKPPFSGASTLLDKLLAHTHEEPPPIRLERMEVSEEVAQVLAKMMAKNPDDRYQSAAEAAAALLPLTRSDSAKEPVFEVVEAIALTHAPPPQVVAMPVVTPAPVSPLVFDTAPVTGGPTVAELVRPKKKKKKRMPWWKEHKWPILGAVALFALIAGAIVLTKKRPTDDKPTDPNAGMSAKANPSPAAKGDKNEKGTPPVAVAPPKNSALKVLYVLPSNGVWLDDFVPVRDRLKEQGVTVVTASTDGGSSRPHPDQPGDPVPIDVRLTATMNLSEYDAVVFCGYVVDEYVHAGRSSIAAAKVIQRMQDAGKPVAGICVGQGVLVAHGVLRNKKAADSEWVKKKFPWITNERSGIDWQPQSVVADGKIVTARDDKAGGPFADAVVAAIRGK